MSTPRVQVDQRKNVIGSNLRRGITPGGFTSQFKSGKGPVQRSTYASQEQVNQAAAEFMRKRGIVGGMSGFERAARNYPRASI